MWQALESDDTLAKYLKSRRGLSQDKSRAARVKVAQAREAFGTWYDSFYQYLRSNTKGWWADYAMKCVLDGLCNVGLPSIGDPAQIFSDTVLSRWPINCPAYSPGIKNLLKEQYKQCRLTADRKHQLLMLIHARLASKLGAHTYRLCGTLAQLQCWQERAEKRKQK